MFLFFWRDMSGEKGGLGQVLLGRARGKAVFSIIDFLYEEKLGERGLGKLLRERAGVVFFLLEKPEGENVWDRCCGGGLRG